LLPSITRRGGVASRASGLKLPLDLGYALLQLVHALPYALLLSLAKLTELIELLRSRKGRSAKRERVTDDGMQIVEAPLKPIKALVHMRETQVNPGKAFVDAVEPLVNPGKALVNMGEALVDPVETSGMLRQGRADLAEVD
jgi:hypothetical protein